MDSASVDTHGQVRFDEVDLRRSWSSLAALAADYWRYQRMTDEEKDSDDMSAWACVHDLVGEPASAGSLDLLDALLASARQDEVGLVAAGPLDELVGPPDQGPLFIVGIEERARRDMRWAKAVEGVWLDASSDPGVNRRLAVLGARLPNGQRSS